MGALPEDPGAVVPQDLSWEDAREYERRTVSALREMMLGGEGGLVLIDEIELTGSRPDTLVVFRYHHREEYVGRHPALVDGPQAELARLWEFAIDPEDPYSHGVMDPPGALAAAIGSAFDASELTLADPITLEPIGRPPNIFPRTYDIVPRPPE